MNRDEEAQKLEQQDKMEVLGGELDGYFGYDGEEGDTDEAYAKKLMIMLDKIEECNQEIEYINRVHKEAIKKIKEKQKLFKDFITKQLHVKPAELNMINSERKLIKERKELELKEEELRKEKKDLYETQKGNKSLVFGDVETGEESLFEEVVGKTFETVVETSVQIKNGSMKPYFEDEDLELKQAGEWFVDYKTATHSEIIKLTEEKPMVDENGKPVLNRRGEEMLEDSKLDEMFANSPFGNPHYEGEDISILETNIVKPRPPILKD